MEWFTNRDFPDRAFDDGMAPRYIMDFKETVKERERESILLS